MNPVTQDFGPCPCLGRYLGPGDVVVEGCGIEGTKLTRYGHLVGCTCHSCLGRRNRRAGKKGEYNRHRRLGGTGNTPRDELMHSYSINVTTEYKHGAQVPAKFVSFIRSEWTRHALNQAKKKLPVGADAYPSLYLEPEGGGAWLVVDVSGKEMR